MWIERFHVGSTARARNGRKTYRIVLSGGGSVRSGENGRWRATVRFDRENGKDEVLELVQEDIARLRNLLQRTELLEESRSCKECIEGPAGRTVPMCGTHIALSDALLDEMVRSAQP